VSAVSVMQHAMHMPQIAIRDRLAIAYCSTVFR